MDEEIKPSFSSVHNFRVDLSNYYNFCNVILLESFIPPIKKDTRKRYVVSIGKIGSSVKRKMETCVSKVIMSPLTAKLKCPHGTGKDTHGAEAVAEVAFDQDGRR